MGLNVRKEQSDTPEGLEGAAGFPLVLPLSSAAWQGPVCKLRQVESILIFRRGCKSQGMIAWGCVRVDRGFCKARGFLLAMPLRGRAEKEFLFCF